MTAAAPTPAPGLVAPTDDRATSGDLVVPGSRPYPWPFDRGAVASSTALVLVGLQRGLATVCPGAQDALAVAATLADAAQSWGAIVIRTRHASSPAQRRPSFLPAFATPQWELLDRPADRTVVDAFGVDGFAGSPLAARLAGAGIDHLLVCGLGLEGPVHSTLRSANDRGLECLLVIDGCVAFDPSLADPAVRTIEMSGGIFGAVATSDQVLGGLAAAGIATSSHA